MTINAFIEKLNTQPNDVEFNELMSLIDSKYKFTETGFANGDLQNAAGENSGSCKLFAFAQLNDLNEEQTLKCFGAYYREEVLQNPDSDNHQNIRNFMKTGWDGLQFDGLALA